MPDRYWVGGTASWDGTAGTKWSATSGGAGGASVPTTADDVFFDASSTGTVTIATGNTGARSINCTGFTGTITGTASITVAGSVTLDAGQTYTHTGTVTFTGTGTLTTAGKEFSGVNVDGAGITLTLGDALNTATRNVTVTLGALDTAGYNVTVNSISSNNSNVRAISLGSSTITISTGSALIFTSITNFTFNAGTSQINLSHPTATINSGGLTFHNVSFTGTSAGTRSITGANTFNNLLIAAPSSAGIAQLSLADNQTVNGTLSTTGTAGNCRVWIRSNTYGTNRTLFVNSAPSLTDADFRDITVLGASAPISGTRIGNRGACAGIGFSPAKTVYWNLAGAQNWSANGWAVTSAGTPNTDNFPLPQDTAVFDNAGSVTGTIALDAALAFTGTVDMSARTSAMTLSILSATTVHGSWINGSGVSLTGGAGLTFSGEGTKTITSVGKTFGVAFIIDAINGTVELADALNIGTNTVTTTNGTFDTKSYNVTAGSLSSNNSNTRTIILGSSTITLSSASGTTFASITNLTFNAGTSSIVFTGSSTGTILASGNLTFYDVSFTGTASGISATITGNNTFNSLSITAPVATGLTQYLFSGNQTVNGTLVCAGASPTRRIFIRSNTIGTTRTITAAAISANDCDFRDITLAGAAAGASPTRAGDCGGNSGITFPAAKTVYRVGTGNWSDVAWSTTSGGNTDTNNFPLAQDTAVIDNNTASGTLEIQSYNIGTINCSTRTNIGISLRHGQTASFYGSYTLSSVIDIGSSNPSSSIFTYSGSGNSTFTTAGVIITYPITINTATGSLILGDALTYAGNNELTLTRGTFDAVSYNVTVGRVFIASLSTIRMGSGLWTLQGTGAVWAINGAATFNKGTADILLSDTSSTARSFAGGNFSYNKLTIGGTTGTSTLTISDNNQFTELASNKTVAHTIALGTTVQTFGKWSVTGTAGNMVTLTGTGTSHVIAGSATSGIDYLAMGSIGFSTASPGEFYAGPNSTGTAGVPVYRTAPPTPRTLYWVGGSGNWSDTARWSTSSGGSGGAALPTSLDDVVFDSASSATSYTATVNSITGNIRVKSLTIGQPASGTIALAGSGGLVGIHGDVTFPVGMTRTYTGAITLSGSTTGRTFTTNGVTLASSIEINGVGCEWNLGSALDNGGASITVTNGSFDTANYNVTALSLLSNSTSDRVINLGSSTISVSGGGNAIAFSNTRNLTFNAGTSQINIAGSTSNFNGGGQVFYDVVFNVNSANIRTLAGANTFNNLTLNASATGLTQLSLDANQTVNGTFTCTGSSVTQRGFVRSDTIGTTRTITAAAISANDCDFRDITIAGAAAGASPTRAGDCGGNSGITFPAAKTVYRVGTNTAWEGSSSWATTSGGAGSNDNFPLAQDTAVIDEITTLTGTLGFNFAYNIGALDASTRTTGITLSHGISQTRYGSYTLGSGVTINGTNSQTFSGRGTMVFTSAGKTITFPITVDTPGGTFQLGDAYSSSNTITHTRGTFDANNYNITAGRFDSNNTNARTLTMGSGVWTLSAGATSTGAAPWVVNSTNLTFSKDSADIVLSGNTTAARSFFGGGLSYNKLTIGGNTSTSTTNFEGTSSFTELTSTKTIAHTVRFGANPRTIGTWSITGSAGNVVTVESIIAGTRSRFNLTNVTSDIDYLNIRDIGVNQTDRFYVGSNSTDSGNNLNATFAHPPLFNFLFY
jgi:hypothetical protein